MLSDREQEFVKAAQAVSGLPSVIKECIFLGRLLDKDPDDVFKTRREVNELVNEEYPRLS